MKQLGNVFNSTNITKILVIFTVGLVFRILIYHYLGINVFSEYTSSISILYYFSLSSISVCFDQLFSFHLATPTNIEFFNVKHFNNDYKTGNLLFTKDHNNPSSQSPIYHPLHHKVRCKLSWYSLGKGKTAFASYEEYKLIWDPKTSVWKEVKNFIKWSFHWVENKPSGIFDPEIMEAKIERERRARLYRQAQYDQWIREENKRMARYHARFGK